MSTIHLSFAEVNILLATETLKNENSSYYAGNPYGSRNIESFNGNLGNEFLNLRVIITLAQVKSLIDSGQSNIIRYTKMVLPDI